MRYAFPLSPIFFVLVEPVRTCAPAFDVLVCVCLCAPLRCSLTHAPAFQPPYLNPCLCLCVPALRSHVCACVCVPALRSHKSQTFVKVLCFPSANASSFQSVCVSFGSGGAGQVNKASRSKSLLRHNLSSRKNQEAELKR